MDDNLKHLLEQAKNKIKQLQMENERMSLRLKMFDDMMALLTASRSYPGYGEEINLVGQIDKYIEGEKKKEETVIVKKPSLGNHD